MSAISKKTENAISKRQKNYFVFALHVAASAMRGLRGTSAVLRSVVYRSRHRAPQHSTSGRGFALLASLLCSFQRASGDEKREEVGYQCDNSTYS